MRDRSIKSRKYFNKEIENGYEISKKDAIHLFDIKDGPLYHLETDKITQTWITDDTINEYMSHRLRTRKTEVITLNDDTRDSSIFWTTSYELTNKFEAKGKEETTSHRYEITSGILPEEYVLLNTLADKPSTVKTRLIGRDKSVSITQEYQYYYSVDIYPDSDTARIELEFIDEAQASAYKEPEWLLKLIDKE